MNSLVIDDPLRARLSQCSQPVNLCDSAGTVLGCFVPKVDPSEYEPVTPLTSEEWDHIMQSNEWYTTEEVLHHLETL